MICRGRSAFVIVSSAYSFGERRVEPEARRRADPDRL